MTRILLTGLIIFLFHFITSAQFKKGDILLGGQFSYSHSSNNSFQPAATPPQNDQKFDYGNFTISAGKSINENSVFGINLSYSQQSQKNYFYNGYNPLEYKNYNYAIGIFFRKYKPLGKEFFIFGEGNAFYNWSTQSGKDTLGFKTLTGSGWGAGIVFFPGIAYKISKHFFIEITIPNLFAAGYSKLDFVYHDQSSPPSWQSSNNESFSLTTSLSSNPLNALGIGFRLIL